MKMKILMVVWAVFLLGGFISISLYRQQQFQKHIDENIVELEKRIEKDSMNLTKEWEALDKSDPEEISTYFNSELFSLYFVYFLEYNRYIQNMEKSFFSFREPFRTQAYEYAVLDAHFVILSILKRIVWI